MNDRAPAALRLLNDYQRDFPLLPRPFAEIGRQLGLAEDAVLAACRDGLACGRIGRIGGIVAPRRIGASTLAAMQVPVERIEQIAARINAQPEVNHNYQREGDWNLWFVVAAASVQNRERALTEIGRDCALPLLSLPLREEYYIDLGFDLNGGAKYRVAAPGSPPCALGDIEHRLMAALENGLPLVAQPFKALGEHIDISEHLAIELIENWLRNGTLKRFGIVVRHHELGFTANAMCVWDLPQDRVDDLGRRLAALPGVTLCYQRERALPHWPYNLYGMIHGKQRAEVEALRARHAAELGLDDHPHAVLFSVRRFKQCAARYARNGTDD
ncbi:MAG: Lrp/AsnC family transcriptional regulator [Rhodocyclaceae bacterium]|jgi:DNA-binding Lrp family transcriptional regulator|nr:Lrp/AsnC family transcriptional regulator [Rhodocyclaceae bacterium]